MWLQVTPRGPFCKPSASVRFPSGKEVLSGMFHIVSRKHNSPQYHSDDVPSKHALNQEM